MHRTNLQEGRSSSKGSREDLYGIAIALTLIGLWIVSTIGLCLLDLEQVSLFWSALAVLVQTFLYTGLFVTTHDAMHGTICPNFPRINRFIGSVAVTFYALFPYDELLQKHGLHHRYPASDRDPDYHAPGGGNPLLWYLVFMQRYWSWRSLVGISIIYNFLVYGLHFNQDNLVLFWVIPSLASSVQLFFFGTFLPHREPEGGYGNQHRARSSQFPAVISFLTCYHFGYHEEHHRFPHLPWWRLPAARRSTLELALSED